MNLYLLRHAIAEPRDDSVYPDDSRRPLSKKGRIKMDAIAKGIKSLAINPDIILTSPYKRTLETAEILHRTMGLKKEQLILSEHLTPGSRIEALVADINAHPLVSSVVLVGHEPDLSRLISFFITGKPSTAIITMKKAGLCHLRTSGLQYARCASLEWLVPPSLLAVVGSEITRMDKK